MTLEPDASKLTLYVSAAMDVNCDDVIHPKRLFKALCENAGPFPPMSQMYTQDSNMQACMLSVWDCVVDWYVKSLDYLIENEGVQVIFSHLHSVDFVEHTFIRYMQERKGGIGFSEHDPEVYDGWMREFIQTSRPLCRLDDALFRRRLDYYDHFRPCSGSTYL